jgi:hypothetical protein
MGTILGKSIFLIIKNKMRTVGVTREDCPSLLENL